MSRAVSTYDYLRKEELQQAVPKSLRTTVDDELVDHLNNVIKNHKYAEDYRSNILGFSTVLNEGKFKVTDYLNAVLYCSYKMMGKTNIEAYTAAFPDKIMQWRMEGLTEKDISSYVCSFNKGKLVNKVMEFSMTPSWVLNQDAYQEAINTQVRLMRTANSEKVQCDAANSLLNALKRPEAAKIDLNVSNTKTDSALMDLRKAIQDLSNVQKAKVINGEASVTDIAVSNISDGEFRDE
jgi:hypothetical protein